MTISKKTLATVLIGFSALIGIVSIFCFFGAAWKLSESGTSIDGPTMFTYMFGGEFSFIGQSAHLDLKAGMTVLFVIELIILLLSVVIIAGNVSKKLKENTTICLTSIVALLTLVAVIMSFCTKSLTDVTGEGSQYAKLGAGALSYSILGIVGIISNVAGIIFYKKSK